VVVIITGFRPLWARGRALWVVVIIAGVRALWTIVIITEVRALWVMIIITGLRALWTIIIKTRICESGRIVVVVVVVVSIWVRWILNRLVVGFWQGRKLGLSYFSRRWSVSFRGKRIFLFWNCM